MNPKFLCPAILLLATFILHVPTVYSCVNLFASQGQTNGVFQGTWLNAILWDGGGGSFTETCTLSSNPPYNFGCNSGYSAVFNDDDDNTFTYNTPHGSYTFSTDYTECGGPGSGGFCSTWKTCQYGCSNTPGDTDCFVYDCGLDYWGCKPGY